MKTKITFLQFDYSSLKDQLMHMLYMQKLGFRIYDDNEYDNEGPATPLSAGYYHEGYENFDLRINGFTDFFGDVIDLSLDSKSRQEIKLCSNGVIMLADVEYETLLDKENHREEMLDNGYMVCRESSSLGTEDKHYCRYALFANNNFVTLLIGDIFSKQELAFIDELVDTNRKETDGDSTEGDELFYKKYRELFKDVDAKMPK